MRSIPALTPLLALAVSACGTQWDPRDVDGDGVSPAAGDCWDLEEGPEGSGLSGDQIYPGAVDDLYDGIDADCAGNDDYDLDGDGWVKEPEHVGLQTLGVPGSGDHLGAGDCWNDPDIMVEPVEGFDPLTAADAHPGVLPEADLWYDGYDADCASNSDFDQDFDDYASEDYAGEVTWPGEFAIEAEDALRDCLDVDPEISPEAQEICDRDGVDEDCDDLVNSADDSVDLSTALLWYADGDDDGFGDPDEEVQSCDAPDGYVADDTDCDDLEATTNPAADETCDGEDDDCDSDIDEDDAVDAPTWYADNDGDGYGDIGSEFASCEQPPDTSDVGEDCDDEDPAVNPGATEICDAANTDEDCNNLADDLDSGVDPAGYTTFYVDGDGDGYGDVAGPLDRCDLPSGYVEDATDCDDADGTINPGATEVCDAADTDEDCDGLADDADSSVDSSTYGTFYADTDGDGYGDSASTSQSCDVTTGFVADSTDCDDGASGVNPGATEVCDAADTDEDCDGLADDDDGSVDSSTYNTFYSDADGDGFGDSAATTSACDAPSGTVSDATDCDDDASTCTTDCSSDADGDGVANCVDACADADGDEYGTTNSAATACLDASGASCVVDAACTDTDCDDADAAINPGATEVCDAGDTDEDCNGLADNADSGATGTSTYYADSDGDGYGDPSSTAALCDATAAYISDNTDCDDTSGAINPAADEVCNDGADNDCDGTLGDRDAAAAYATCAYSDLAIEDAAHALYTTATSSTRLGGAIRMLGDIDGDGATDVGVGAPYDDSNEINAGGVYILTNLDATAIDYDGQLSLGTGSAGALFYGNAVNDIAGTSLAGGDLDGDGTNDVFVGAPYVNRPGGSPADHGAIYMLESGIDFTTGAALASAGTRAWGLGTEDELGASLSAEGDTDGDGDDDLLVGAPGAGNDEDGYALLLTSTTYQASGLTSANTLRYDARLIGADSEEAGTSVQLADLDADGFADAIVGAPEAVVSSASAGRAYFVEGPVTADVTLASEASLPGPTLSLGGSGGDAGLSVGRADVNGDGYDDALVGARGADFAKGVVYVVLGGSSFFPGSSSMSADVTIAGSSAEQAGYSVAGAGDIDGDSYDEIILGARAYSSSAGAAYLVTGPLTGGTVLLSSASNVAQLTGASAGDEAGHAVHGGGDVDGDGYSDFGVAAPGSDSNAGSAYLFLGLSQ